METTELLTSRSLYAAMKAQNAGNMVFDGHLPTAEEKSNADECRMLCDKIDHHLRFCHVNEIPLLLSCHYILYLIGYSRMPDLQKMDQYKLSVVNAWQNGDNTIEESDVFELLSNGAFQKNTDSEYVMIYQSLKTAWLGTLQKFNRFPDATAEENYERLALTMQERLGQDSAKLKRQWYAANKASNLSLLSTAILRSYLRFVSALYPDVLRFDEQTTLKNSVLKELSSRPDLDSYAREAYSLALDYDRR